MAEEMPSFELRIQVNVLSAHTHAVVAPTLDALNERWVWVETHRTSFDPPAAGPEIALLDIALTAAGSGFVGKAVWDLFFSKITSAAGERIQSRIVEMIRRGAHQDTPRPPFSITCGGVRFYVEEELSSEEIARCLHEARRVGNGLSDDVFVEPQDGTINGLYWDKNRGVWLPPQERRDI